MLLSIPHQSGSIRPRAVTVPIVCVVDPNSGEERGWNSWAKTRELQLHVVGSAEEALRLARSQAIDLWVINTELPGLSGIELCGMLNARSSRSAVYLVTDHYTPEIEQLAWQARATCFGCKAERRTWLLQWLESRHSSARAAVVGDPTISIPLCNKVTARGSVK